MDLKDTLSLDSSGYSNGMKSAQNAQSSFNRTANETIKVNSESAQSFDNVANSAKRYSMGLVNLPPKTVLHQAREMNGQLRETQKIFKAGPLLQTSTSQATTVNISNITQAMSRAAKEAAKLSFRWRMAVRIFESFVIYRGLYALGNILASAVQSATEFQIKISQIRTISQDNQLSFMQWSNAVKDLSNQFGLPIIDVATAAYETVSNQIGEGRKSIEFMTQAQKLAIATSSSMADTVNALSGIMNAYGFSIEDTNSLSAKLFTTIDLGRIKMADLGNIIGDVSAVGALLGVNIDELLASVSEITIRSILPSRALTNLRQIMTQMLKPSTDMQEALDAIGVDSASTGVKVFGLLGFLKRLADEKPGLEGLAELFRNVRGFAGAALLTSNEGFKRVIETTGKMQQSQEKYADAIKIATESVGKNLQVEVNRIKNFFTVDLGFGLLEWAAKISSAFGGFDVAVKALVSSLQVLLIPALISLSLQLLKLAPIIKAHPLLTLAAAIPALLAALKFYATLEEERQNAIRKIYIKNSIDILDSRKNAYKEMVQAAGDSITAEQKVLLLGTTNLIAQLNKQQKVAKDNAENNAEFIVELMRKASDATKDLLSEVNSKLTETKTKINQLKKALQDLKEETQRREIEIALEDKKPAEQIDILKNEVKRLITQGQKATIFEDVEFSFKEALKYADDIKKITDDIEKERRKIEKEIKKERNQYEKDDTRLRKQQAKSRGDEKSDIKKQRLLMKGEYTKTISELEEKLAEVSKVPLSTEQVNNAIRNTIKLQEAAYKKLGREAVNNQKTLVNEQITYETRVKELTEVQRLLKNRQFIDIIKKENIDELKSEFTARDELVTKQINLMRESGAIQSEIDKVAKMQLEEQAAIESRINENKLIAAREITALKEKELGLSLKTLTGEVNQKQDALRKLEVLRLKGEFEFRQILAARGAERFAEPFLTGGDVGDMAKSLEATRRRAFIQANVPAPEVLYPTIEEQKKAVSFAERQVELFLATFPKIIEATKQNATAATATTSALSSLTLKIYDVESAYDGFKGALENLTGAINAASIRINPTLVAEPKAFGGIISKGKDSILAMLSPGEYVMNAKATRRFYSQLVAMNSAIPAFANGGPVTTINGDFNISLQSSGNATVDVQQIGRLLHREIRRGTVKL